MTTQKHSLDFGKKEKVLNYATQTYQLSRPNKVGAVMALIRERLLVLRELLSEREAIYLH